MAVLRVEVPPGYPAPRMKSPPFSTISAVRPGLCWVGLAGGGVLLHLGRSEPRKMSDMGLVCPQGPYLLSALSPVYGLFSPLGCYALSFPFLLEHLRKGLERYSP